ncbi:secondary thiamine-phosphate synthase enzyme YjbQ [Atopomonas sediminilitoris]|uniref:secondary thiamine-phosphate synthase enzyme YjbQ n=1 Tax=Atopomonas sediminilitoris TaxID=2919919 RepID=UPI001F4EFFE8|nr:secondary thiamine-phosphate synthase enzyme YjbQ [Atopomonas sediminilitoris]MCJ8168226.1 secondary thiamine-phosphate synthase enzyme YjbQ [Atopomonas sediminilitoris]
MWQQVEASLRARSRGFHLIDDELQQALARLKPVRVGLLHVWLKHTSASLSVNENADPLVRGDLARFCARLVPDGSPYFQHTYEGADDMPAHVLSALLGCSVQLPISNGRLALGTWQGVYLGEHREHAGIRRVLLTLNGEPMS